MKTIHKTDIFDHLREHVLGASAVGGFVWDLNGDTATFTASQCKLTGLGNPEEHMPADEFFACVHIDDRQNLQDIIGEALNAGSTYETEFRFVRPSGETIWLGGRGEFVKVEGEAQPYLIGANFDVTALKRAQQRATDLAAEMAHRISNLLGVIHGMSRLETGGSGDAETALQDLKARLSAVGTVASMELGLDGETICLSALANSVLEPYGRAGQIEKDVTALDLNTEAAQAVSLTMNELAATSVRDGALNTMFGTARLTALAQADGDIRLSWTETGMDRKAAVKDHLILHSMVRGLGGQPEIRRDGDSWRYDVTLPVERLRAHS